VDEIYERFLKNSSDLFIKVMEDDPEKIPDDELVRCKKYQVLLIDCSTSEDVVLNKKIVDESLAEADPRNKHYLSAFVCVRGSEGPEEIEEITGNAIDEDDIQIHFPKQELIQIYNLPENSEFLKPLEGKVEIPKNASVSELNKDFVENQKIQTINFEKPMKKVRDELIPRLLSEHPASKITWQQSETFIKLSVTAIDCVDYSFELSPTCLAIM
jgi:hypothetical protein